MFRLGDLFFSGWDMTSVRLATIRRMDEAPALGATSRVGGQGRQGLASFWIASGKLLHNYMEHHHFQWVDPRTKSPFSYVDIMNRYLVGNIW